MGSVLTFPERRIHLFPERGIRLNSPCLHSHIHASGHWNCLAILTQSSPAKCHLPETAEKAAGQVWIKPAKKLCCRAVTWGGERVTQVKFHWSKAWVQSSVVCAFPVINDFPLSRLSPLGYNTLLLPCIFVVTRFNVQIEIAWICSSGNEEQISLKLGLQRWLVRLWMEGGFSFVRKQHISSMWCHQEMYNTWDFSKMLLECQDVFRHLILLWVCKMKPRLSF